MATRELETKLIEANISIADSLKGINDNLKTLNDHNILHSTKNEAQHDTIIEKLKTMTEKYWWLIIILIVAVLLMAGYTKVASLFIPGV